MPAINLMIDMTLHAYENTRKYINREYSWFLFNKRVLDEAANRTYPLFERLKFLAIFESNLDEFYMVRASGLIEQYENNVRELSPDGLTPKEQLQLIADMAIPLRKEAARLWSEELKPLLSESGILIKDYKELSHQQKQELERHFRSEIFPLCTPLMLHPAPTVPFISNQSLNLAVQLDDDHQEMKLARVKVPTVIPRLVPIQKNSTQYVLLEDLIKHNVGYLFPGVKILSSHRFRVIRGADIEISELEAGDLIDTIEKTISLRRFGAPVLLEINPDMPKEISNLLLQLLDLSPQEILKVEGVLGMDMLWEIIKLDKPKLLFSPHHPYIHERLHDKSSLFETISNRDVLIHHPFDSFQPVEEFVDAAATDPNVIGIKQTLYRVGSESPIIKSLLDAAEEGKQVAAMVELKARFDESNNLVWARALERAGVHVTYGFPELKTHCKLCLIVRKEGTHIRAYVHIGTGNYNPITSKIYTDLGLFTSDPDITKDVIELFNSLTGFSKQSEYRKLLVAPVNLRKALLEKIHRETRSKLEGGKGHIIFKLNALVDTEIIDALYKASQAGVRVELIVRGICCLIPGAPGLSENIRVVSIVGRFLEHNRIYYFGNNGNPETYIGSADLMTRNLDRRVEVLVPVEDPRLINYIKTGILEKYLLDNQNAWVLNSDGTYEKIQPDENHPPFAVQQYLMLHPTTAETLS